MNTYDSTADTLAHSRRVGELLVEIITDLLGRVTQHDLSKLSSAEKPIFDSCTHALKSATYGSGEYFAQLAAMKPALDNHYSLNAHHPEFHDGGINGMNLADLIEMLADWKAATERHDNGNLAHSLEVQRDRFGISDQLMSVLENTARAFKWLPE